MTEELKQKIKEQLLTLPKDSQQALESFDWILETEKIAKEHNIPEENSSKIATEIVLILCRYEYSGALADNIAENVSINKKEAEEITQKILKRILKPISDKRIEIIKQNIKTKIPTWDKWMKFVLSGGDYSVFGDSQFSKTMIEPKLINTRGNLVI
ncbi:MAG: hypothetical protein NTZ44_01180 [Candidatus Nomurabacteria bacterium]|nr:hypothetical protein [Candidatus Nomurabacteria bacterium]